VIGSTMAGGPWRHRAGRLHRAVLAIFMLASVVSVPSAQAQSSACFAAPNPAEVPIPDQATNDGGGRLSMATTNSNFLTNEFFANKMVLHIGNGSGGFSPWH